MFRKIFSVVSVVAMASAASAADMYHASEGVGGYKDTPYFGVNWSGLYAGVQGGWSQIDDKQALSSPIFALSVDHSANGGVFGGHVGYNIQSGKIVYGAEVDFEGNSIDKSFVIGSPFVDTTGAMKLDWQASVRGRLGYAMDRALVYATGGVAFGHFVDKYDTAGPLFHQSVGSDRTGWTVGGGVEYAITPKWSASVEYRYTDWGTNTNNLNVFLSPPGISKDEVTENTVRLGVSYHVGPSFEPLK
jgi:outer membrane immunogenic protein